MTELTQGIFSTAKISGVLDKVKKIKDPRRDLS